MCAIAVVQNFNKLLILLLGFFLIIILLHKIIDSTHISLILLLHQNIVDLVFAVLVFFVCHAPKAVINIYEVKMRRQPIWIG